ncbi:MAG: bifunctional phosphopantothenoylcysteine decarboxylase/phosphopantothenate--cysteine ligase CoaBC [Desulfuromonadales bacterium]|nr:bifunctional phosphopantothenoylcysteine decarboxylase/phosphopantothenate--cysteine ligase CoaBC [Desulfuromonadales bacterium]
MLNGKKIVLGVTGGIAVYKAVELLRLFVKSGAEVHVIMTEAATKFVAPLTFQTLSGNPVHTDMFNLISEQEIGHISLADKADLFVIAPATANIIGKIAVGIADDLLTTTVMATKAPLLLAPAMNVNMYDNPIYQENEAKLRKLGYYFTGPVSGYLACGWDGKGKMMEPAEIFEEAVGVLTDKDMAGIKVLITAGPTLEAIDPVRFISNHSSGKMGYALAKVAKRRGAKVTLISGPVSLPEPSGINFISVKSAKDMEEAVTACCNNNDVIIKAAAVADYRPASISENKMKKGEDKIKIDLVKTPDILANLGKNRKLGQVLIGFAAETTDLINNARKKLEKKSLDLIVANDVTLPESGFNSDKNIVKLLFKDGTVEELPSMAKEQVAYKVLDAAIKLKAHSTL